MLTGARLCNPEVLAVGEVTEIYFAVILKLRGVIIVCLDISGL